jgi:hypothetical protein
LIEPSPDQRVDELRQRLRALGYLDAGVNRFVLGPARGTRRPAAIALLASVRVGIIAAVLLGPAAAIGLAARLPGLVTGPRDSIVIALYMGALFGLAVSVAAFASSLIVASLAGDRVARRARTLSTYAGLAVAIACLVYLTLWWRTASAGFGWSAPVWTGFALVVAVAISLLLGHAVSVTAMAVIVAGRGSPGADRAPGTAASLSWRLSLLAGLLAFGGAAALLLLTAPGDARRDAPPLTVVSSGLRVRLFAIDGFDPGVFDRLKQAGRVRALDGALASAHARIAAEDTRDPARAWTTIATGQPPDVHGVHALETRRVAGLQGSMQSDDPSRLVGAIRAATDLLRLTRPAIASGQDRREKTLWEVASDAGLRSVVVNWWATWPAHGGGIIVSDRATLRLERGGALDAEIAPASLYERLRVRWPAIREAAAQRAAETLAAAVSHDPAVGAVLERSAEVDAVQVMLAREASAPTPDLLAVYLPGLDIAQHALLDVDRGTLTPSAFGARVDALREYYVFLDTLLAASLTPADDHDVVVLVTGPGRISATADGLIGMRGLGPAARAEITGRAIDITPTVLHLLGVPLSAELAGVPLADLFPAAFITRHPVRHVATYGRPSTETTPRTGQPLDSEMIERLRSLGYVR